MLSPPSQYRLGPKCAHETLIGNVGPIDEQEYGVAL
jgi:hypothetical protein